MSKVKRLLPKRSMIRTIRGEDWHVIDFWYLPEVKQFEIPNKHLMGGCKHCKTWSEIK